MNRNQKVQALRILRAAKVGEPTTMTPKRAAVYRELLSRDLVVPSGERRGAILCRLTKAGETELAVLNAEVGELSQDYAVRTVVRRATGDRGGEEPGEVVPGFEVE